jgi:hypothetical protein
MITEQQKADIRFHYRQLGNTYIPTLLNIALNNTYTEEELSRIATAIAACNTAYNLTQLTAGTVIKESEEIIQQNNTSTTTYSNGTTNTTVYGNRTKSIYKRPSFQQRITAYNLTVRNLLEMLTPSN